MMSSASDAQMIFKTFDLVFGDNKWSFGDSCAFVDVTIVKTKEWEIYVVVNKGFELFFGTVGEEDVW